MSEKRSILALLLVMVLICPATVIGSEMTALDATGAGAGATVVASAPVIELVSADPDVVTTTQGVTIPITITADVFAPNGIGWIESVVISNVEPHYFHGTSLPIEMGIIDKEEIIRARYEVTIDILCCQPVENYTVTVTVADKDGNTANGTATVTVEKALASSVAVVEITPSCARIDSAVRGVTYNRMVTISNSGNETRTFDLMPEGGCSDWINVYNEDDPTTPITDVTIDSNKKARLIVKCAIPEDVANGDYTAIVSVHSKTKDKGETAQGVAGQYFRIHVTVKGKQNLAARVGNITISDTEVGMPVETLIEFENTGMIALMAKFIGAIYCNGKFEVAFDSEEELVAVGKTTELTADYKITAPGDYKTKGYVTYSGKETQKEEVSFTVSNVGAKEVAKVEKKAAEEEKKGIPGFEFVTGMIAIAIVTLLVSVYRRERGRL